MKLYRDRNADLQGGVVTGIGWYAVRAFYSYCACESEMRFSYMMESFGELTTVYLKSSPCKALEDPMRFVRTPLRERGTQIRAETEALSTLLLKAGDSDMIQPGN